MRNHVGARAQRESRELKAKRPATSPDTFDPALERYLRLQSALDDGRQKVVSHHVPPVPQVRPHGQRAGGPLHHQRVIIDGRDVEVIEDAVGVVELYLD